MSEKVSKFQRKQGRQPRTPVIRMVISIFENGDVNVDNFPIDLTEARKALWRAETAIISHAIKQVEEGRDAFNEPSRIIRPMGPLGGMKN